MNRTMLTIAIITLTAVVSAGGWLGGLYMLVERPPDKLRWPGLLHGAGGLAGTVALWLALRVPHGGARAARYGAPSFALIAAILITLAALAGLAILSLHLRKKTVTNSWAATHGLLAITGYVLLITYLTMLT